MIIEIPDDNSIVKWKMNDRDDWTSAEISDLIKVYEERPSGDLISREALKKELDEQMNFEENCRDSIFDIIDDAQAVEISGLPKIHYDRGFIAGYEKGKEYERPKAKWIEKEETPASVSYYCSNCETEGIPITPFCPWCGADMRGDKE